MAIKNKAAYIESLKKLNTIVYYMGERIENMFEHPAFIPHINSAGMTYELACMPESEELLTATSHLTGNKINRFTHIHQNRDDLIKKAKALRLLGQKTGACFQRCVGWDAINAIDTVTYEIDKNNGTEYHKRFNKFLEYIQENDLMVSGSMTDPKGDRSLKPSQQKDPDLYLHVVEQNDKGIVIRGAKAHNTGVVNSHEMLIMPTTALGEEDKDYAVCCAVPVDAEGVVHIFGRQTNDSRRMESGEIDKGNFEFGMVGGEALTVLDNVFVPWERVFMCGEYEYAYPLVERFATYHRSNYGACKTGVCDTIIGSAAVIADYNGVSKSSRVKETLVEMNHLNESLYCCSIACASESSPLPSGTYYVNPLLANITKLNVTRHIYEICRLCHEIAGGAVATLPSEQDLKNNEIGHYVEKYFKGVENVSTEDRIRMFRLIENLTGGTALVESMHGAGSPSAQKIMILRQANMNHKKALAESLAGIKKK
jgi:4-hydroxybutyryl-CoA dehydratase/vinylacetyl-CoA-Delta-isomerase